MATDLPTQIENMADPDPLETLRRAMGSGTPQTVTAATNSPALNLLSQQKAPTALQTNATTQAPVGQLIEQEHPLLKAQTPVEQPLLTQQMPTAEQIRTNNDLAALNKESALQTLQDKAANIKNPIGRAFGETGAGLLRGIVGGLGALLPEEAFIPGTDLNNIADKNRARKDLESQASTENQAADSALRSAQAEGLKNPKDEFTPLDTAGGIQSFSKNKGTASPLTDDSGQVLQPYVKPSGNPLEVHDTADGPLLINMQSGFAQHVTLDGQPVGEKIKLTESQPIIDPSDHQPHTYMLNDKGDKVVDLGVHYERPIINNFPQQQTEREYTYYRNEWQKKFDTADQQIHQLSMANDLVGRGALGDAIGSIKALSGLASGTGSGVRITQAELNSIAHARGYNGDFQAYMQKFGDGRNLTPGQEKDLKGILADIQGVAGRKQAFYSKVLDDMSDASDAESLRKIDSQARDAIVKSGGG